MQMGLSLFDWLKQAWVLGRTRVQCPLALYSTLTAEELEGIPIRPIYGEYQCDEAVRVRCNEIKLVESAVMRQERHPAWASAAQRGPPDNILSTTFDIESTSGFLPTYDVVGIPTMSYLPDVAYDVTYDVVCVRHRRSRPTTSIYDIVGALPTMS